MNTRNVLLLILCTSVVSVTTALVTVRLVQNNTPAATAVHTTAAPGAPQEAPVNIAKGPVQISPSAEKIPPPPPPQKPPQPVLPPVVPAPIKAEDFDRPRDTRKPLTASQVKEKLLKHTPDCSEDYDSLCTKDLFLAEHPLACLRRNKEKVSGACARQVAAVQENFLKTCAEDIQRYCPNQSRYFGCLKERLSVLSAECRKNVAEHSRQ